MNRLRARRALVAAFVLAASLPVVALAGNGLDAKAWKSAKEALERAASSGDDDAIAAAARDVAKDDSSRAAQLLATAAVASAGSGAHEEVAAAIATFTDDAARKFVVRNATEHKDRRVRWLFVMALGMSDWSDAKEPLLDVMSGRDEGLAVNAVESFEKKASRESIDTLIAFLEKRDQARPPKEAGFFGDPVRRRAIAALQKLTGQDLEDGVDWRNWWTENGGAWDPAKVAERREAAKKGEKDGDGAGGSNKLSGTVVDRMKDKRPGAYETLERLEKDDIVVVTGVFDQCQDVLTALGLPFTLVQRADFDAFALNPKQVLIFNCDEQTGRLSPAGQEKVREFAARGGYVFTSDWELVNVVAPTFPKTISQAGSTDERNVGIKPAAGAENHPLLRDVFPADPFKASTAKWKIDGVSFTVRPGPGSEILVHSDELEKTYGSGIVAVLTRFGGGSGPASGRKRDRPTTGTAGDDAGEGSYVEELRGGASLHVLSHFYSQKDESGDGFALQQMLLNFIVEKQAYRAAESARKKGK